MARFSFSLDEETKAWLDREADDRGVSTAAFLRDLLDGIRESDSLSASDVIQSDADVNQSDEVLNQVASLRESLAALEARVDDLEGRSPGREGGSETAETGLEAPGDRETPPTATEDVEPVDVDVRDRVREHIGDGPPRKSHAQEALAEAVALLADRGPLSTGELKDALWSEFGEHYSTERTMWNSLDRHLEEIPGVSKPGYGEWDIDVGELRKAD